VELSHVNHGIPWCTMVGILGFKLNKPQVRFCSPHPSSQYAIRPSP